VTLNSLFIQKSQEFITSSAKKKTFSRVSNSNETIDGLKPVSTFDKIINDSTTAMVKGPSVKIASIKSGSRQKNRKNKVILPKIMFYN